MVSYESDPLDRDEWESRREKRRDNTARLEASTPSTAQKGRPAVNPRHLCLSGCNYSYGTPKVRVRRTQGEQSRAGAEGPKQLEL